MTGNNKVWRAPLAGLASVAMLATMGVAAGTANATTAQAAKYNFTVTLNAGDSRQGSLPGGARTLEVKSSSVTDLQDGQFDTLYTNTAYKVTANNAQSTFTGWYLSPDDGAEKFDFANTYLNKDITLYAHYADQDDLVKISWDGTQAQGVYNGAVNATFATNSSIEVSKKDKKIAKWEIPGDVPNSQIVTSWKIDNQSTNATQVSDPVTFDQLATDFTGKLVYANGTENDIQLVAANVDPAVKVTFKGTDGTVFEKKDYAYTSKVTFPNGYNPSKHTRVTEWTDQTGKKLSGFDTVGQAKAPAWTYTAAAWQDAYLVTFLSEVEGDWTSVVDQQVVDNGKAPTAPTTPTRNDGYTFAGWSTTKGYGQKTVDLSSLKIGADTALYAQWTTDKATVTYYYQYANKKTSKDYASGDTFTLPTATRDGWKLIGWYKDGSNVKAEYEWLKVKKTVDGKTENVWAKVDSGFAKTHALDAAGNPTASYEDAFSAQALLSQYDNYKLPENAQLQITAAGDLQYLDQRKVETAPGKYQTISKWTDVPSNFYAAWEKADGNQLAPEEQAVDTSDEGEVVDTTNNYTAASKAAYAKAFKAYLAHKAQLGPKDEDLTSDEAATLLKELQAAQDLLVQTAPVEVVRLKNGAKHVYSTDEHEQTVLKRNGWKVEG
ncbi:InlB B-repeat-containing protein, partial [Bifidobacterium amazonense]